VIKNKVVHFDQHFNEQMTPHGIEQMFADPFLTKLALGKTVLIADDDLTHQFILKTIFKKMHFEVVIAENGLQAVKEFSKLKIKQLCFVVMDIQMPEMNGMEASQTIRKNFGHSFPIYAFSADEPDSSNLGKASRSGMNGWIEKSEIQTLARIVYSWATDRAT